jgi:hypothetical protein
MSNYHHHTRSCAHAHAAGLTWWYPLAGVGVVTALAGFVALRMEVCGVGV